MYLGNDAENFTVDELQAVLQPVTLLDRFIAKKNSGLSTNKEFLDIKGCKGLEGQSGQIGSSADIKNDLIGFECMSYSVTESNGYVEVTVVKKKDQAEFTFGIRTVEDTAKMGEAFEAFNKIIELDARTT